MKMIFRQLWITLKSVGRVLKWTAWHIHAAFLKRKNRHQGGTGESDPQTPQAAVCTVVNDDFAPYLILFLKSLLHYNPWFEHPYIVFWDPTYSPLSEKSKARIRAVYPRVEFREANASRYEQFLSSTPAKLLAALFTLEAFRLSEFDRVVFLDVDMLCLGDISKLFTLTPSFSACMTGPDPKQKEIYQNLLKTNTPINTGVMSIGKDLLQTEIYDSFFQATPNDLSVADQDILNEAFKKQPVYLLPHTYNFHAEFFWDDENRNPDVRILHFAGEKPLTHPDLPRMKIWHEHKTLLT